MRDGFTARQAKGRATKWYNENINRFNRARGAAYNGKGASGVGVNFALGRDPAKFAESLANDVKTGWIHPSRATFKGTADHEFGHMLDYLLDIRNDSDLKNVLNEYKTTVEQEVSRNAAQNDAEFIAEAWAEYRNRSSSAQPRPAALAVGRLIEKRYAARFAR